MLKDIARAMLLAELSNDTEHVHSSALTQEPDSHPHKSPKPGTPDKGNMVSVLADIVVARVLTKFPANNRHSRSSALS